jgi:hypothetical protein
MTSTLETASYGHKIHCNFDAEVCVVLVRFVECNAKGRLCLSYPTIQPVKLQFC